MGKAPEICKCKNYYENIFNLVIKVLKINFLYTHRAANYNLYRKPDKLKVYIRMT